MATGILLEITSSLGFSATGAFSFLAPAAVCFVSGGFFSGIGDLAFSFFSSSGLGVFS